MLEKFLFFCCRVPQEFGRIYGLINNIVELFGKRRVICTSSSDDAYALSLLTIAMLKDH